MAFAPPGMFLHVALAATALLHTISLSSYNSSTLQSVTTSVALYKMNMYWLFVDACELKTLSNVSMLK